MSIVDKTALMAPRASTPTGMPEGVADIPGFGQARVRGLSRAEVVAIRGLESADFERALLARGLIEPTFSEDEIGQWQGHGLANEFRGVTEKISELSGLSEGADKSGLPGDGDGSGDRVGALPGGEAGDDGRPPTG